MHKFLKKRSAHLLTVLLFSIFIPTSAQLQEIRLHPAVQFFPEENTNIATGSVHIVAAMADFQPDENPFTSGNGTFYLDYLDRDDIIIDPLPHDRAHFEAHLEFAKNYFERVSGQQLTLTFEVLPQVYTLDNEMAAYAPIGEDGAENFRLANLARDVWEKAYEAGDLSLDGLDQNRTMFIIFHAGAGRDIELTGTTLYKTPQDIPSVFLGKSSLQRLFNQPDFQGFPTNNPNFTISNTAILPQTQSRAGENILGDEFVLQLSINGIMVANIASFLGLPDLFNTETGASGIGRFGLMDGASIFSYLGMFPPEPSAWEKKYLGWIDPFEIELDHSEIPLPAVSIQKPELVARYSISNDEYFLIENRHRDPDGTGVTLTIRQPDGQRQQVTIASSDTRFNPFNSDQYNEILVPGVVVDVSNFDFSLPGGNVGPRNDDSDEDRILNGGMLIWHIDDGVIRTSLADNRVNANSNRRGVRLVEAEGAQQIGRGEFGLETGRYTNGHAFDFWWADNDFTVVSSGGRQIVAYQNRFAPDTQPSNHSNSGARSYFEFYDFSDIQPVAHFKARPFLPDFAILNTVLPPQLEETPILSPSAAFPLALTPTFMATDTLIFIPSSEGLHALAFSKTAHPFFSPGLMSAMPYTATNTIFSQFSGQQHVFRSAQFQLQGDDISAQMVWENDDFTVTEGVLPAFFTRDSADTASVDFSRFRFDPVTGATLEPASNAVQKTALANNLVYGILDRNQFRSSNNGITYSLSTSQAASERLYSGLISAGNEFAAFLITDDELLFFSERNGDTPTIIHSGSKVSWPAMFDYTGDGLVDFLFVDLTNNLIQGVNQHGAVLNGFPIRPAKEHRLTGTPLAADLTGDGHPELILTATDGLSYLILAYHKNGRLVEGFPLLAGAMPYPDVPVVHPLLLGQRLLSVSQSGEIRDWKFPEMGTVYWQSLYGDFTGNRVSSAQVLSISPEPVGQLLQRRETYNWPNPARDITHIRYQTTEPADITITIISMSGTRISEIKTRSQGIQAEEVLLDVHRWSSGVYYARIRASAQGRSESELIKIVVIQ